MSHSHNHSHEHGQGERNLKVAFLLNLGFTLFEIAGGLWTNSMAILSDAVHDFGDCLTLGTAWYLQQLSHREADASFTYGYRRFSTVGALVTGLVLIGGLGFIAWQAIVRLQQPESVHATGVVGIALVGILVNGFAVWKLHGGHSLNEKVVSWHLLEDTLGWAAVLVGGIVMSIWDAPRVDPVLSLLIGAFILWNVVRNLRKVGMVFLQASPEGFDPQAFDREMLELEHVVDSHHTHTWTLDGEKHVFSTHLVLEASSGRDAIFDVKRRVHVLLASQNFAHITIEIELEGESCAAEDGEMHC